MPVEKTSGNSIIAFTKIPRAAEVGRERLDTISGRVSGARPEQRIDDDEKRAQVMKEGAVEFLVKPFNDQRLLKLLRDPVKG